MARSKSSSPQTPSKTAQETNKKRKRDDEDDDDACAVAGVVSQQKEIEERPIIDDWESFCRWLIEDLDDGAAQTVSETEDMGNQLPMRIVLDNNDAGPSATDEGYLDILDFDGFFDAENRQRRQLENTNISDEEAASTKDDDLCVGLFDFDGLILVLKSQRSDRPW